ncbi:MAG: CHAP domain-containing protein [Candidatus Saccharibacteria bacterium]|nr:CHAP domain-containing protein [Candidatus Saccharibacteria bacterium]
MTKYKYKLIIQKLTILTAVIMIAGGISLLYFENQTVLADEYDAKIKQLEQENTYYNKQAGILREKADSLAAEIDLINAEKNAIQSVIDGIQAQIEILKKEITEIEIQIEKNRDALGEVIRQIYMTSQISTLERLASSRTISDFIDEEAQNQSLRQSLGVKIKQIRSQKEELERKEKQQQAALAEQKTQMTLQAAKEAEKQSILDQTKGDEAAYRQIAEKNNSEIKKLKEQQRQANLAKGGNNVVAGDPNKGGYPARWANAAQDSLVDSWGMYNRECVSYVAWKVHQAYGNMPYWGGRGHAWQWGFSGWKWGNGTKAGGNYSGTSWHTANAVTDGVPYGYEPRVGSAAVWNNGSYGHVMWVERINSNGTVHVSQYNYHVNGEYSEMDIPANSAVYLYFGNYKR